jgi:polyisoprenoid-binding protein YceI
MPTTSPAVQAPPAGRYAIDPAGSSVTFVTKHMFGLGKVRGRLEVIRGVITVDRYAHGITMLPGMAARRLSVQITARATRA